MIQRATKLMSALPAGEYFARGSDVDSILTHAGRTGGLRLASAPFSGASEVLRRAFDTLFFEQDEIIPFYFALRETDVNARTAAVRFLREFLTQTVAFRRRDPSLYYLSPDARELVRSAAPSDSEWIASVIDGWEDNNRLNDERAFVRSCLSAPLRAIAAGSRVFVMFDDLHRAPLIDGGSNFLSAVGDVYARSAAPYVVSARRRMTFEGLSPAHIAVDDLRQNQASEFASKLARSLGVAVNDQTCDLIALQTGGNIGFIRALISTAAVRSRSLDSFQSVERHWADEILDGRLGGTYRSEIASAAGDASTSRLLIRLLQDSLDSGGRSRLAVWQERLNVTPEAFARLMRSAELAEVVTIEGSLVNVGVGNYVLTDHISVRSRIDDGGEAKPVVHGELLTEALKRAPRMMASFYRREASLRMAGLLLTFDCQKVPLGLIDYRRFRESYKGLSQEEVVQGLLSETDRLTLPQIVHAVPTSEYYPPLAKLIEPERSVAALGFVERRYADDGQTVWLTAEVESKSEAARDVAEFWCDRLEMASISCGFENFQLWLIAPEGFSPEALDLLSARGAYGSSRKQVEYLRDFLNAGELVQQPAGREYEMVIPVGDDTELIAAHAVEEIARRHNFPPRSINQIKTALVEACINAAEHGLSPDGKIYQHFIVDDEKIVVTISNRGIRLADTPVAAPRGGRAMSAAVGDPFQVPASGPAVTVPEGRRGWGLKLIRGLMDDVKIEAVDDGTRISMTKYLNSESRAA